MANRYSQRNKLKKSGREDRRMGDAVADRENGKSKGPEAEMNQMRSKMKRVGRRGQGTSGLS